MVSPSTELGDEILRELDDIDVNEDFDALAEQRKAARHHTAVQFFSRLYVLCFRWQRPPALPQPLVGLRS